MKQATVGMDLGGSNLFSVAYDMATEQIILESKIDTEARGGYTHVLKRITSQLTEIEQSLMKAGYTMTAIGLGVPGTVDADHGMVHVAPNLDWQSVRPVADLQVDDEMRKKIWLINDVNAGLLGELSMIKPKPDCAVAYFCGTGIGGAIALHGQLFTGTGGSAGEVGHMVIRKGGKRCQCGRRGCLEAYIGKWALNARIQRALIKNKPTLLKQIIDYDLTETPIKSSSLKKACAKKDPFARKLMERYYASYLAAGISQTVNLLSPDVVILGGGIMEALGDILLTAVYDRLTKHCIASVPSLRLAALGDYAGTKGAAFYAAERASGRI
jgi:glucokinase